MLPCGSSNNLSLRCFKGSTHKSRRVADPAMELEVRGFQLDPAGVDFSGHQSDGRMEVGRWSDGRGVSLPRGHLQLLWIVNPGVSKCGAGMDGDSHRANSAAFHLPFA
jgi:hypothetical protein